MNAREDSTPSEREQILAAERDRALASVRKLVAIIARHGGYMAPEHQADYREAKALVRIGPIATTFAPITPDWAKR